jgi:hypothetical protein
MSEWQPIETVPEDVMRSADPVLLWSPDTHTHAAYGRYWTQNSRWEEDCNSTPLYPTHWQPLPPPPTPTSDTAAFLSRMRAAAETGERVTADDVARLRKLADWADAPPPAGWNGTLDRHEAMRAIEAAERRLANGGT